MLALPFGYGTFAKILFISSAEKALIVSVRTLPSDPALNAQAVMASGYERTPIGPLDSGPLDLIQGEFTLIVARGRA
jgi:hypothetical protein